MSIPFVFHDEHFVQQPVEAVFPFFSNAENLQEITPPWVHLRILSVEPNPLRKGTRLAYALRWGIFPIRWLTEIVEWEPPQRFVDVQLKGPYRLWRHEHRFVAADGGTRICDDVQYMLPLGWLGKLAHRFKVQKDLEKIFAYRREAIKKHFPSV